MDRNMKDSQPMRGRLLGLTDMADVAANSCIALIMVQEKHRHYWRAPAPQTVGFGFPRILTFVPKNFNCNNAEK
eukprot:scaffold18571_cov133-Skeletonema_dohrnii-CCMP3373.AAC.4